MIVGVGAALDGRDRIDAERLSRQRALIALLIPCRVLTGGREDSLLRTAFLAGRPLSRAFVGARVVFQIRLPRI
jgi:hypothetical protein